MAKTNAIKSTVIKELQTNNARKPVGNTLVTGLAH